MKTYILSIIKDVQRYSEELDAKAILCNKTWIVFNDAGDKEVYIFKKDGLLRIVLNGRVFDASWELESSNESIIINGENERFMVRTAFVDGTILALNIDGTDKYSFLIEEKNAKNFAPKTLEDLNRYFLELKQRKLEENRKITNSISNKVGTTPQHVPEHIEDYNIFLIALKSVIAFFLICTLLIFFGIL